MSTKNSPKKARQAAVGDAEAQKLAVTFVDPLLTTEETAARLGLNPGTLAVWRCLKTYPLEFVRVGRSVRYRASSVEAWLRSRTVAGDGSDGRKRAVS